MKGNSSKFLALLLSASMIMSPTASVLADTQEKAAQTESSAAAEEAPQSEETAEPEEVITEESIHELYGIDLKVAKVDGRKFVLTV